MKIKTFGYRGVGAQLPNIEKGLQEIGHEIVEDNPDFVYCNNGLYDEAIEYVSMKTIENPPKKIKTIFNVLDIPEHVTDFPYSKLAQQLDFADYITAISESTSRQVEKLMDRRAVAKIIYQPTQNVYVKKPSGKYNYKYLYVGRANDPNKRFDLVRETLKITGEEKKLAVVGTENPFFGNYLGVLSEEELNDVYNSVEYVWMPSNFEGLGLPAIEAVLAGKIPLLNINNPCSLEFLHEFAEASDPQAYVDLLATIEANMFEIQKLIYCYQQIFKYQFNYKNIAKNIDILLK